MRLLADYDYHLPAEQIAQEPARERTASRLLVVGGQLIDRTFADLPDHLPAGAVLVVNDTRVLPARLHARKDSGGRVELLAVEPDSESGVPNRWRCLARASKPIRAGCELRVCGSDARLTVVGERGPDATLVVEFPDDPERFLSRVGEVPLPPYIERPGGATEADRVRYQTVFARNAGAVAAPTAGLHFSPELLSDLESRGHLVTAVTLHVGPGTFAPVRSEAIADHQMHAERFSIPESTAELVASGRPVVAVGTTVVRALESAAIDSGRVRAGRGVTSIFIRPGHRFRAVDHLVTNFHLPRSTLLMLVAAFAGYRRIMDAYQHAVASGYRFYSYGDAMLLGRGEE